MGLSLRARFALIVVVAAVAPMVVLGFWLTGTAARSGERLLVQRLGDGVREFSQQVEGNWIRLRSHLLTLGETPAARSILKVGPSVEDAPDSLVNLARDIDPDLRRMRILDVDGQTIWTSAWVSGMPGSLRSLRPAVTVRLPLYAQGAVEQHGSLEVELDFSALMGPSGSTIPVPGAVMTAVDPQTGASLLTVPFDPAILDASRFAWRGEEWITSRYELNEPHLQLVAAAPVSGFTRPFDEAARRGSVFLVGVAFLAVVLSLALTRRATATLRAMADAAEAVSAGDLTQSVEQRGSDELGRLAKAFNDMTENLRRTLQNLADRQALAAIGEFAASLSHEIRNSLTSIRLDLQMLPEELPPGIPPPESSIKAIEEIDRLGQTVEGALKLARSGKLAREVVELLTPLRRAIHASQPEFQLRRAQLETRFPENDCTVYGDPAALEQVFINILLNAAQSLEDGSSASVELESNEVGATVSIADHGQGIPKELMQRIFEPFVSTKPEGTGLGLSVAQRIVRMHDGRITIESQPGEGTRVDIWLPTLTSPTVAHSVSSV